jgi:hypothetical protein
VSVGGDATKVLAEPKAITKEELLKKLVPAELANKSDAELMELAKQAAALGIDPTMFSFKDIPPPGDPGKGTNSS